MACGQAGGSGRKLAGGTSTGKRKARGKRKALLDVLDQVTLLLSCFPLQMLSPQYAPKSGFTFSYMLLGNGYRQAWGVHEASPA